MHREITNAFDLTGRVAVVTGAGGGIGRDIAGVLAGAGAIVACVDRNEAAIAETVNAIARDGGSAVAAPADIASKIAIDNLARDICDRHGRLDIWVNSAGVIVFRQMAEVTQENYDKILSVNLAATYWSCIAAARHMSPGGSIVNISSTGGEVVAPLLSLYSLSKAGVNMVTRCAATEFGPSGIRVNAVAPGFVDTDMPSYHYRDEHGKIDPVRREAVLAARAAGSPLGLIGEPRDMALAALYLASDASKFVTGQIIRPNGGAWMP